MSINRYKVVKKTMTFTVNKLDMGERKYLYPPMGKVFKFEKKRGGVQDI